MASATRITPAFFDFLTELKANNNREWFQANKARYEGDVRDPFLHLLSELASRIKEVDPAVIVDPRPVGGSMMRIHRDIRFSKDKSPYKTGVAAHFGRDSKLGTAAAYYIHLAPGESMLGAGIWRPEAPLLGKIRDAIAADPDAWHKAVSGKQFGSACGLIGESLQKAPRGYDPAHPAIEDIKRKDFAISVAFDDKDVCSARFLDDMIAAFKSSTPLIDFLNKALAK